MAGPDFVEDQTKIAPNLSWLEWIRHSFHCQRLRIFLQQGDFRIRQPKLFDRGEGSKSLQDWHRSYSGPFDHVPATGS
jgi:hypothetical protein